MIIPPEITQAIARLREFPEHSEEYTLEQQTADIEFLCKALTASMDAQEALDFALNYLRLPLKIDPTIDNLDTAKLLIALQAALDRRGPEL